MAGASMKDIKLRIKSVQSTMQITKAMELVASSKLRKAKLRQEKCRPFYEELKKALDEIEATTQDFSSVYQKAREEKKVCLIVIGGDRGLAGGYNGNIFKAAAELGNKERFCILPIGKRAVEFFDRRGYDILSDAFSEAASVSVADCFSISEIILRGYRDEQFDRVLILYTRLNSLLSQTPDTMELLPLGSAGKQKQSAVSELVLYEPGAEAVYDSIVPNYIAGMLYGAMCESVASELAARRTAMDAASKNAAEMIEDLSLRYNRARQGAITQEITEIVAGAEH